MLQITDSSDLGVVVGSSGSITAKTITSTGSITVSNNGTITAGFLSIGTVSASAAGHGTTTVRFLNDIIANGTVTATGFVGNGSQLTGVSATVIGTNAVDSSQLVNTLNITDTTINVGSLTVSAGNFRVDSAGSMTATTITSTGSTTASGTLTAANSTFRADTNFTYVTTRLGIGTTTPGSSYLMQVTSDGDTGVVIGSGGSMTAKTLAVTGSVTASTISTTGTATIATTSGRVGIGTTTPGTTLHVIGTVTATGFSGPGASKIFIRKSSDETVTSSNTLQDDDELLFAIAASETWDTDVFISMISHPTPDFRYGFTAPAGLTSIIYGHSATTGPGSDSIATSTATAIQVLSGSVNLVNGVLIKCLVVNGANAGTVTFQWAQNTASGTTTTVTAGSFLVSERLK